MGRWHPLHLLIRGVSACGLDTADRLGGSLGVVAWHLGIRRRVVQGNMALALPGHPASARRWAGRRCYASMGATFLGLLVAQRDPRAGPDAVTATAPTHLARLQAGPLGVVWLTLHLGNWDLAGAAIARSAGAVNVYATPQHDAVADALINGLRQRLGMTVVLAAHGDRRGALTVLKGLRDGVPVGLLADQGPPPERGSPGWFLGQGVSCHLGPGFFACRTGAPLVVGCVLRRRAGVYRFYQGRRIDPDGWQPEALMQYGLDRLSALIAAVPGQYFWHHRRFKYRMDPPVPHDDRWRSRGVRLLAESQS